LHEISRSIPGVRLVAGDSGDIDVARRSARQLGIEKHVLLPGYISGPETIRRLAEAAICVLPSYNEGVPINILDAMSVGLPIVTTPVGGIPDVIRDGEGEFLVAPCSIDQPARRIIEQLSSEDLRNRTGENARRRLRSEYSPEASLGALMALYQSHGAQPLPGAASAANTAITDA
jgi:glycosyltransferase involved in cell wall biosynthesis